MIYTYLCGSCKFYFETKIKRSCFGFCDDCRHIGKKGSVLKNRDNYNLVVGYNNYAIKILVPDHPLTLDET